MPPLTSLAAWPLGPPLFAVIVLGFLYRLGGQRRVATSRARRERWRAAAFYGGLVVVLIALDSPLDVLADQVVRRAHGPARSAPERRTRR